jgi:hypothetical protein
MDQPLALGLPPDPLPAAHITYIARDVVMTYTFKLSRRLAHCRALALAALLLLAVACDQADSFGPDDNTASAIPFRDPPVFAAATFAGGIPMGMYAQPTSTFGDRFNGGFRNIFPQYLLRELADIKARGGKAVLTFAGHPRFYTDVDGYFSLSMWKSRVDLFRSVNFSPYVADGTIVAHYLIDEPNDGANFNGRPVPPATLEQMAQYSKQIWPELLTVVRVDAGYLGFDHRYLDAAWAQYVYRKGNPADYIKRNVEDAQARRLGLVTGLNVLKGGINGAKMTASQVQEWGSTLLASTYPCAFLSWHYDESYVGSPGMGAAMDVLRQKAQNRAAKSCDYAGSEPTQPPPPPPTSPSPVAGALPFGVAALPLDQYSSSWTGTAAETEPATLVQRLDRAGSSGMAVVATLAPAARTRNADGTFSLARWKAEIDRYRSLPLAAHITGRTLYLHNLVDQPKCAECWGGRAIAWEMVEEMARYSKAIWPALPTTVRVPPSALAKAGFRWNALDAGWAQYSTPRGNVRTWLAAEAAQARAEGLGLVAGLNLLDAAGRGSAPMTADQIREFGTVLAQDPSACALVGWSYDAGYLGQTGIRDALRDVAAIAKGRQAGSCVVS